MWQLRDAKSKFSELVNRAMAQGTQIVTRRGKNAVVVMPFDEYKRLTEKKEGFSDFLLASPFAGSEIQIDRDKSLPRRFEIEP